MPPSPPGYGLFGRLLASVAAVLLLHSPIHAQRSPDCPEQIGIPGGSNAEDRTIHRCNLDNSPVLQSSVKDLPTPMYARDAHSLMTIVVDSSGTVNPALTRYWSISADSQFYRRMLATVKQFVYERGVQDGKAVRYGQQLAVRTDTRRDSIPQRLSWRYVHGVVDDSLVGTWVGSTEALALSADLVTSAAVAVTRTLKAMQVLQPSRNIGYCIITAEPFDQAAADGAVREMNRGVPHGAFLQTSGCDGDVSTRRYRLADPLRTGGGRMVLRASGDLLSRWPPGLDARWWPAWQAYCAVPETSEDADAAQCDVQPVRSGDPVVDGHADPIVEPALSFDVPIGIAAEITTSAAFRTDTVRASIARVPSLHERPFLNDRDAELPLPDIGFRLTDIREEARRGDHVLFRIHVDRAIPGLVVYARVRGPDRSSSWQLYRHSDREFDFTVRFDPVLADDTEFWIYLVTVQGEN